MTEPTLPADSLRVVPHLVVAGAARAIEFYAAAFGAEEIMRMPAPGGDLLMHAEIRIGESHVLLCDEMPGAHECRSPSSLGGTSMTVHLVTGDADALFARAVAAGATPVTPVTEMFWGERYGKFADPFGHHWSVSTKVADLTPMQIAMRARAFFAGS